MRELIIERGPAARRVVLLVAVVGLPTFFLRVTNDPFNIPKLALLITCVAVAGGIRLIEITQGRSWRGVERLAMPAALLAVPLVGSWLLSPHRSWALIGQVSRLEGLVPYLLTILLGLLLVDAFSGHSVELALGLAWAGAIVAGYAIIQVIGLDPFRWSLFGAPTDAVSTTGNPNFTGGFLGIALPIALALTLADASRRRVAVRLTVVIVLGWVLSKSQGGWAAGIAGCALVTGYFFRDRWRFATWVGAGFSLVAASAAVGIVVIAMIQPGSRFTIGTALVRARWWQAALEMGFSHPVAGRGPNSFALEAVSHRPLSDALQFGFDFPDNPHSVLLAMFANLGIFGAIAFLGTLGWAIWYFTRQSAPALLQVGFFGGVIAYFVQAAVSIDELTLRVGLWIALAGLASFTADTAIRDRKSSSRVNVKKRRGKVRSSPVRARGLVAVVALVTGAPVVWAGILLFADAQVRGGLNAFASANPETGRSRFASALALHDSADYKVLFAYELRDLALADEPSEKYVDEASAAFRELLDEAPYVYALATYGRMLDEYAFKASRSGDPQAVALLRRALGIDSLNPLIRTDLASALNHLERYDEALEVLRPQIDVVPADQYGPYWAALALAAAEEGEFDLAERALGPAVALAPDDEFTQAAGKLLEEQS